MLHKYLRPRFAWGAAWRKHRREGGERLLSGGDGRGGGSLPISILGTRGRTRQLTSSALGARAQQRQLVYQPEDSGIRDSRFASIPSPR